MKSFQYLMLSLLVTSLAINAGGGNRRPAEQKNVTVRLTSNSDSHQKLTIKSSDDETQPINNEAPSIIIDSQLEQVERREITLADYIVLKVVKSKK